MQKISLGLILLTVFLTGTSALANKTQPTLNNECRQKLKVQSRKILNDVQSVRSEVKGTAEQIGPSNANAGQMFLFLMVGTSVYDKCNILESGIAKIRRNEVPSSRETKYLTQLCEFDGDAREFLYKP